MQIIVFNFFSTFYLLLKVLHVDVINQHSKFSFEN